MSKFLKCSIFVAAPEVGALRVDNRSKSDNVVTSKQQVELSEEQGVSPVRSKSVQKSWIDAEFTKTKDTESEKAKAKYTFQYQTKEDNDGSVKVSQVRIRQEEKSVLELTFGKDKITWSQPNGAKSTPTLRRGDVVELSPGAAEKLLKCQLMACDFRASDQDGVSVVDVTHYGVEDRSVFQFVRKGEKITLELLSK